MSTEAQDTSSKPRPGFLSEILSHNEFLQTVHPPESGELQQFRYVLGDGFTFELAQLHAPLYVFNGESNLGTVQFDNKDRGSKIHLPIHRYLRTNFAIVLDGWVVFINTYQARSPSIGYQNKAARFDFMLLDDWMDSDVTTIEAGTKKLTADAHANGLFTRGSGLLRTIRHLVLSVPEDCRIDVHPANEERERLYKKMFANRPNIIMHINEEDRSSPLKLLKRKIADLNDH